jgi:hypothetical protein
MRTRQDVVQISLTHLDPGSEFRVYLQWFDQNAMGKLLEADFAVAKKNAFPPRHCLQKANRINRLIGTNENNQNA